MKTALGLIVIALVGVASSQAYGLSEAGVPAVAGSLRHLDEVPPMTEDGLGDVPMEDYDAEAEAEVETDEKRWGGGCRPGSWRWPSCRWGGRCRPGSWRWPRCRWGGHW